MTGAEWTKYCQYYKNRRLLAAFSPWGKGELILTSSYKTIKLPVGEKNGVLSKEQNLESRMEFCAKWTFLYNK